MLLTVNAIPDTTRNGITIDFLPHLNLTRYARQIGSRKKVALAHLIPAEHEHREIAIASSSASYLSKPGDANCRSASKSRPGGNTFSLPKMCIGLHLLAGMLTVAIDLTGMFSAG